MGKWENVIVKFEPTKEDLRMWGKQIKETPFEIGKCYLCLGEIKNMPEHFIYVDNEGKIYWGYHDDLFRLLKEEEV